MRPAFLFALYGAAFAGVTIVQSAAGPSNPAHELAQKFAIGDQPRSETKAETKSETKAAPKPAAKPVPVKSETQAQAPVAAPAPAAAPAVAPPAAAPQPKTVAPAAKPRPPAPGTDYERDMLEAARAEADARKQVDLPAAPPAPQPAAQPATPPPAAAAAPQAEPKPDNRPAAAPAPIKVEAHITVPSATPPVTRPQGAPIATVLAVLTTPLQSPARRVTPPDPVICLGDGCYISEGPDRDARLVSRADALSTKSTILTGAGACKGTSRCAFRGVSLRAGDEIQIIDLGIAGHDKREPADMTPDKSCHVDDGDLVCEHPVTAPDYRIWVVPETVAAAAGPGALEAALADDLPEEDLARADDK